MIDFEAVHVQRTMLPNNPDEDMDPPADSQVGQQASQLAPDVPADESSQAGPVEAQRKHDLQDPEPAGDSKKSKVGEEQPVTPEPDDLMLSTGERSPKTPRLAESPRQQRMQQVTSTDLDLYEHEDSAVQFKFDNSDLDKLEQYEFEFYDDELLATDGSDANDSTELSKDDWSVDLSFQFQRT